MRSEAEIRARLKLLRDKAMLYPRLSIYDFKISMLDWVLEEGSNE